MDGVLSLRDVAMPPRGGGRATFTDEVEVMARELFLRESGDALRDPHETAVRALEAAEAFYEELRGPRGAA